MRQEGSNILVRYWECWVRQPVSRIREGLRHKCSCFVTKSIMGKAKKSRAVRVKFAQAKRLLSPKDCRLKGNIAKEDAKRKKVGT